ncbi:general substrate transporter [Aspergillus caelatus]|uniref:General substrate transporter n=1 Tax=Aspergillus caelatus TaxID=61420 RepID=A0A5N6ZS84_9EURO|nr:general substrate transporter [Aspergillus caelatus]KAE8360434.1 general substrate transporter [Aspergillus caelatus]
MWSLRQTRLIRPPAGIDPSAPRERDPWYVYKLAAFVSLGALLFGYDQGVMGVIVADQRFKDLMHPKNSWVTGAIVSMYDVGCFIGAMSTGSLSDRYGRERMLAIASIVFVIGAVLQAASYTVVQIIIGRIVLGYGVGGCAAGVPLYQSEIAPPTLRGRLIGIEQMVLCTGELCAFWMNYGFNYLPTKDWWRIPLAIQILPAIVLGMGCWFWVLPSPRWLVTQDRHDCAREVLVRLHGPEAAATELEQIQETMRLEKHTKASWRGMFKIPILRLTLLGCGIQGFQQVTGTNSILYYTPTLFEKGGITDPRTANLATGGVGIAQFVSAWIPIFFFDRLGRKVWLQIGTVGMMLAMVGIAVLQWRAGESPGSKGNYAIVVFPYLFYIFFNISWGVAAWTYPSEIFPLSMRAKGNALATSANWTMCYIVAQASPPVADAIGWGLYVVYAAICVIALAFVRFALVETRNRLLEDMNRLFGLEDYFAEGEAAAAEQIFVVKDASVENVEESNHVAGPS